MSLSKLLIVDDDRDFADGLAEVLEMFGHSVDVAFTGRAGVEAATRNDYDAVVMDVSLRDPNGVESLRKIQEIKPDIRCFLITGYDAADVAARLNGFGARDILTKPFDPEVLSQRLIAARQPAGYTNPP
jgi:DNA-binding response OmpR family regulator